MIATASQIRHADQRMHEEFAFPSLLLMETAGRRAAEWLLAHFPAHTQFSVLVGPGNNGGDGLVMARYLRLAGRKVQLLLAVAPERFQGDAQTNWRALSGSGIPYEIWSGELPQHLADSPEHTVLIDALLGTGVDRGPRGAIAEIIAAMASLHFPVVAVDLPSGLSADTGAAPYPVLQAAATLTFQCAKVCHCVYPAAAACGEVVVLDIGIWPAVMAGLGIKRWSLDAGMAAPLLHNRPADGHKGTFGHALCVGGSRAYAGAIALTGMAALQSGAGLSSVFTVEAARCAVLADRPELMVQVAPDSQAEWLAADALPALHQALRGKTALALGPGLGNEYPTCDFMKGLLQAWDRPLVIDADGLNVLASEPELWRYVPQGSILTPHPGEMARLLPGLDVKNQRLEAAEHLAQQKQVIVVLKGAGSIVALPDGKTYVNTTGNDGMATGGSGDVLTGLLAGLLAQGYVPEVAARLGVYLHGLAGDLCAAAQGAAEAVTASGIAAHLGKAMGTLREAQAKA